MVQACQADGIAPGLGGSSRGGELRIVRRKRESAQILPGARVVVKSIGCGIEKKEAEEDRDCGKAPPLYDSFAGARPEQGRPPSCAIVRQASKF
jgi:hypothetical protein